MSDHTFEVWDDPSRKFVRMTRYNPPGLRALAYRGAPYHDVLARMLTRLPQQSSAGESDSAPLGRLHVDDRRDWTIALLRAWAAVTDVLTFYQERVTNEGYLNTALEDRSVLELTRAIGYTIRPGLAASTALALTVTKRPDQPHQIAALPAGLAVQSTAVPGSVAQQFETSEPFEARSEWNALKPTRYDDVRWRQDIREDATELRLHGLQTGLSVGDTLIVVSQPWLYQLTGVSGESSLVVEWQDENFNPVSQGLQKANTNALTLREKDWILLFADVANKPEPPSLLVKLTTVNPVPTTGTTVVSWEDPIEGPVVVELGGSRTGLMKGDQLLVVGEPGGHLRADAPRLVGIVSAVQAEPGYNRTTVHLEQDPRHPRGQRPIRNPRVLALRQKAALFTYTSSGLFANTVQDKAWRPQGIGLPDAAVRGIIRHSSNALFVATAKGLFRSVDEGATWQALTIGLVPRDVHALTLTVQDHLLVGTDKGGIFLSKDQGENWHSLSGESVEPYARGLRKWFPKSYALDSLPKVVVHDLVSYQRRRIVSATMDVGLVRGMVGWLTGGSTGHVIAAATDVGVFRSTDGGRSWRPANHALPNRDKKTGLTDTVVSTLATAHGERLFAATSAGVYRILDRPRRNLLITIRNILILVAVFYAFNRLLLGALARGEGPLYGLLDWLSGGEGLISQLLNGYVSGLITLTTRTTVLLALGALALLSLLAAIHYWSKHLDARERTGVAAHTLLASENDADLKAGDRLHAGTEAGVFRAEPSSRLLQVLGRPVGAWQPSNLALPLFELGADSELTLNSGRADDELRATFKRHGHLLPGEAAIRGESPERQENRLQQWRIDGGYVGRRESPYLQVMKPAANEDEPAGRLSLALQADLSAGQVSPALRHALKVLEIDPSEQATVESTGDGSRWLIGQNEGGANRVLAAIQRVMPAPLVYRGDAPPLFLIEKTPQMGDDLDKGNISRELRAAFQRHLATLPPKATIETAERGRRWLVRAVDDQVLVTIRQLDDEYLLVYQGLLAPVDAPLPVLPQKLQTALDKADLTAEMRQEFDRLGIQPQDSKLLFIAFPGLQWYVLNGDDTPIYEIWRIGVRLVVFQAQAVHALDRDEKGNLLAGTDSGELHRRLEGIWRRFDAGLTLTDIDTIKTVGDAQFVAGIPPKGSTENGWESSHIRKRWVDLDRVYPSLRPGSLLVLNQATPWRQAVYVARRVEVVDSADLTRTGRFTRVEVDREEGLAEFDRNLATVWGQSESLALHDDRPVSGKTIALGHPVPGLEKGKRLIVRGKPMRARIVAAELVSLKALTTSKTTSLSLGELLKILKVDPGPNDGEKRAKPTWRLQNADRFVGTVEAGYDEIVLEPAADDDSFVNESVELDGDYDDSTQTELTLSNPLGTFYDRSTVTILANIVPATHGQTIAGEVLGSSEGAVSYERLRLRQEPLTYLSSATSSEPASTLRVYVNGVEWRSEPFFSADLKPNERVYVLHGDEHGGSTIVFGNGVNGARLPPNTEQVTASYRIGSGSDGNVPADSLVNLRTRVANLQDVTNPLPASGGVAREAKALTRQNAPRQARASQRIVSLTDYEDFAAAYPGIGKAHAELLARGNRQVICITVADQDGQPIATESMLLGNLRQAIDAQRARPWPAVEIQTFTPVYFNVTATLFIRQDHWKRGEDIERAARARVVASFGFEQRDLGQMVTKAELIAVLHSADAALTGVAVTALTRDDSSGATVEGDTLRTQDARELLMINAEGTGGIILKREVAS